MRAEGSRRRKLAELVPDHVLGDVDRDELLAVVDTEGESNEFRSDRRTTGPSLDRLFGAAIGVCLLDFLDQVEVDVEAFFDGTSHGNRSS